MTHAQDNEPTTQALPETAAPATPTGPAKIKRTRVSGTWVAVIVALIVLVFLLIFILQNLGDATVQFLGMSAGLPLGVAMLLSAIGGALLVALVGGARIAQLRRATRRAHKALQSES
ncbi:lipopolysaccharide assembly LapA domain-containing protein [Amycolatopsis sp. GM8]|uniref:LapA family protein n=1 Tax=Amycolatopsis sp. GM8 TaxID=2896530 RepID=UPI001F02293C|nr:lipopolysaccharide assembly protein LapA domain-containing protein [Amycolatopsis sp. GM8]